MTEMMLRDEPGALEVRSAAVFTRLSEWADEARAAAAIATSLCKTSFVPEQFRGRPEEATAAILTGHEMGLSPMASLRSIYVVKGTPAMYANALRAVVQAQGHDVWVEESTATRAIVCARRKNSPHVERVTWTLDRAKQAGLLGNPNYTKNPQNMLIARATAEACRRVAADALHGIPYAVEELEDGPLEAPAAAPAEVKPARRTAQRAALPPAPEPELDEPTPEAAADVRTDEQSAKFHAQLRELGKGDRETGLAEVSRILGVEVTTTKTLSRFDAGRVLDDLEAQLLAAKAPEPGLDDWPDTAPVPDGAP